MKRSLVLLCLLIAACGDDEVSDDLNLPSGCSGSSGIYATEVINANLACVVTNAFTDTEQLLGAPDASSTGPGEAQYRGFVSLGTNGSVTVFMGSCIEDLAGSDIRVFQSVSREAVEVQASANQDGPFVSLGAQNCSDSCDFDLNGSGLSGIRFLRIIDRESITFPEAQCDSRGLSPGADIDAIQNLHPVAR
jgi:hypothetical protein